MKIDRQEGRYTRREHGVGHGHRNVHTITQVRWHIVGDDGQCIPALCSPGYPACGFTRQKDAKFALARAATDA